MIVVRGRLFAIGKEFEEAAMDLGASPVQALRLILLPMLAPAVFAALMIVFAISIDDFVISQFLKGGADSETVPVLIYSNVRAAPTPALNALVTVMLVFSMLAIAMAILVSPALRAGGPGGVGRKGLRPPRDLSSIPAEWSGDDHIDHLTTTRRSTVQLRTRSASCGRHTLTGAPD